MLPEAFEILTRILTARRIRDEHIKRLLLLINYYIVFCANYEVGEAFEFSCAFIVAFFDLIKRIYVEKRRSVIWNFAQLVINVPY